MRAGRVLWSPVAGADDFEDGPRGPREQTWTHVPGYPRLRTGQTSTAAAPARTFRTDRRSPDRPVVYFERHRFPDHADAFGARIHDTRQELFGDRFASRTSFEIVPDAADWAWRSMVTPTAASWSTRPAGGTALGGVRDAVPTTSPPVSEFYSPP